MLPVINAHDESPHTAAMHVVPEGEAVACSGWLHYVTDQDRRVVATTRWGVHVQVVTWRKSDSYYCRCNTTTEHSSESDTSDLAL